MKALLLLAAVHGVHPATRLSLGYSARDFFGVPAKMEETDLGTGARFGRHFGLWGSFRLRLGTTPNGLHPFAMGLTASPEAIVGPLRASVGAGFSVEGVNRALGHGYAWSWGPNLGGAVSFDAVKTRYVTFFVRTSVDASVILHSVEKSYDLGYTIAIGGELP